MGMFCYQCEQTAKRKGCTSFGICGKNPETASLQDLLIYLTKGIAQYGHRLRKLGISNHDIDLFVIEALFTTVTNVNFDPLRLKTFIEKGKSLRDKARDIYEKTTNRQGMKPEHIFGPATTEIASDLNEMIRQGESISINKRIDSLGSDITALQELLTYGLKGMAAYADHAQILGKEDESVYAFFHEALDFLTRDDVTVSELMEMNLRCGKVNLRVMELLDQANTGTYGNPVPTPVRITPVKGKAILVSGHDLKDLEELLKQTKDTGINVYTHGEMLPAHGYPGLKKYPHLIGNYGGAWQDQRKEFEEFPGAILMTTNCIQKPKNTYKARIFTSGLVAWPGVIHLKNKDFSPLIEAALEAEGFKNDEPKKTIMVGFAHNAVLGVAPQIIDAVKSGNIRHFFLIGGCDGAKPGRNYYTRFAEKVPEDCIVLTLACGKFRFNKLDFGYIDTLPRLLDMGQCNDAYSAIRVAQALSEAFDTNINSLPLSLILSWYEQKAICILLTLLYLGIKDIRLGPSVPAFVTPAILKVLEEQFSLHPITTVEKDLEEILGVKISK